MMMRTYSWGIGALLIAVLGLWPSGVVQAQVDRWTAHTSMRVVEAVSVAGDALWVATTGGIFSYTPETGAFQRFTAAEGLYNVQTRAIAYDDRRGVVWIGYRDGVIDRLNPETGEVRTFFDIQRNDRFASSPEGKLTRLVVHGDSLLAATAFGLVIFDPIREEVRDTYSRLGTLTPATPVRDVTVAPLPDGRTGFWLATTEGIAYAPLDAVNLQDPNVWAVEQAELPARETYSITQFQSTIYVGTVNGLARREADGSYFRYGFTNRPIFDMTPLADRLLAVDDFKLYAAFASDASQVLAEGFLELNTVTQGPNGNIWIGSRSDGLTGLEPPVGNEPPTLIASSLYPDGPFEGLFSDLAVDDSGVLWAGSAGGSAESGFYRLDTDGQWTDYTRRTGLVNGSGYRRVHAGARGSLWASSAGDGIVQVQPDGEVVEYDQTNSSLLPASGFTDFLLIGGAATEADGTLWATSTTASRPLNVRTPDGAWTALPPPACEGIAPTTALGPIFIDSFGNKWIIVLQLGNLQITRGLMVLDTGASPTDPSDDDCQFIGQAGTAGQGLPSTGITSITEDREGQVWIGTDNGPAFVLSSSVVARDATAIPIWPLCANRSECTFMLEGQAINGVAVDPSNRLWVGTNEGVYLLETAEGGYDFVEHFTAENSPLFSNAVGAVAVDGTTGSVYFATDQGLVSFRGDAVNPSATARDLLVYPNPVRLQEGALPEIVIDGLVEETMVRVLAPHGEVVARFDARGGRARWDGRDSNRELVPSGVYLVVAEGLNGEGTAYGKVAIIR